jgi:hypothetical protein
MSRYQLRFSFGLLPWLPPLTLCLFFARRPWPGSRPAIYLRSDAASLTGHYLRLLWLGIHFIREKPAYRYRLRFWFPKSVTPVNHCRRFVVVWGSRPGGHYSLWLRIARFSALIMLTREKVALPTPPCPLTENPTPCSPNQARTPFVCLKPEQETP